MEQVTASNTNRLNGAFNNALVGSQQELGKLQGEMATTFQRMEQNYQTVTDRTKQTEALMHKVQQQKQATDGEHKEVQQTHAEMLKSMQEEQADFDRQMQELQATMGSISTGLNATGTPPPQPPPAPPRPPTLVTPAPPAPDVPDKYEVMIDGLEKQSAELEAQMQDLDSLLGSSTAAFMAAVNATSTLKAENATSLV